MPLREIFENLDQDQTGFITPEELAKAIRESNLNLSQDQIEEIMENVDIHKNGKINYSEFLAATISLQDHLTEEKLWMNLLSAIFKFLSSTVSLNSTIPLLILSLLKARKVVKACSLLVK